MILTGRFEGLLIFLCYLAVVAIVKGTPSITPAAKFDVDKDVDKLHDILTQSSSKSKDLWDFISSRSCDQRVQIKEKYNSKYQNFDGFIPAEPPEYKDLVLNSFTCGGELCAIHVHALLMSEDEYDKDLISIVEILITATENQQLHEDMQKKYEDLFQKSLHHDVDKNISNDFGSFCLELVNRNRAAPGSTDLKAATETAKHIEGEHKKWGNHRGKLDRALLEDSFEQVGLVFEELEKIFNKSTEFLIASKMKREKQIAYVYTVTYDKSRDEFFADRLWDNLYDVKTLKKPNLTRLILLASERNMVEVQKVFKDKYHVPLRNKIEDIVDSGDYKNTLLAFLQKEVDPKPAPSPSPAKH